MHFTLRQLEYLVAIADHGSFHAAARACHVSQPGLSAQIQQLEDQLGVVVFERDRRSLLVTDAGREILQRARDVLDSAHQLSESARVRNRPLTGRLRLGVIPTIAPYLLPKVLPGIRKKQPELVLELHEAQTAALVERIALGRLDVLLVALEAPLDRLETESLFRDEFLVALPSAHPLARKRAIGEAELADERILLLDDGHCLRDQALSYCRRVGLENEADFRASSLSTLLQMVIGGAGITFLPALAAPIEGRHKGLTLVPLRKPVPARTIGLAWRPTSARVRELRILGELLKPNDA